MAIATGTRTRYEIILEGPSIETVRIPLWVCSKTRDAICSAVQPCYPRVVAYVGKKRASFEWSTKLHGFATRDGYVIRYSGRTQRECESAGLLPILPA